MSAALHGPTMRKTPGGNGKNSSRSQIVMRARPLMRQTPGATEMGDTVDYFFNHKVDFDDDEVFGQVLTF